MLKLRELRERKGLKQKDLACLIGIPPNTLNQYENNKREPDHETLCRFADFFLISLDELLRRNQHPSREVKISQGDETIKFNKILKQLRKLHYLTQLQLGQKLNLAESTISLYESGKRFPDQTILLNIATLFNVSLDYLLGYDHINTLPKNLYNISNEELDIIKKYRSLPDLSKDRVKNALNFEYEQNRPAITQKTAT